MAETKNILIIDPDVAWAQIAARHLRTIHFDLSLVSSGMDGLRALSRAPAVVFTELRLPDMSGVQFALTARQQYPQSSFLLIAVTGQDGQEIVEECLGSGFDYFFSKAHPPLSEMVRIVHGLRRYR